MYAQNNSKKTSLLAVKHEKSEENYPFRPFEISYVLRITFLRDTSCKP